MADDWERVKPLPHTCEDCPRWIRWALNLCFDCAVARRRQQKGLRLA